jgi:DNA-binding LacI/PurR family transcriptional regulator
MMLEIGQGFAGGKKTAMVRKQLREMALQTGSGGKLPTVRELRSRLGAANTTLNDALRDLQSAGVLDRRHGSGIYVSTRIRQKRVGLVFGGNVFTPGVSPFYSMLVEHCGLRAGTHGLSFSYFLDIPEAQRDGRAVFVHRDLEESLRGRMLDGLLLTWPRSTEHTRWLRSQGIPVVAFDLPFRPGHVVSADHGEIVKQGVRALCEQGCRRIALLSSLGYARPYEDDRQAFAAAMAECGLEVRPQWMLERPGQELSRFGEYALTNEEQGYQLMNELFRGWGENGCRAEDYPDGVVFIDDMYTRGALVAAWKLGVRIGRNLRIATHLNKGSSALRGYEQELTLLEVDLQKLIEAMFDMLESLMAGERPEREMVMIRPKLAAPRGTG